MDESVEIKSLGVGWGDAQSRERDPYLTDRPGVQIWTNSF